MPSEKLSPPLSAAVCQGSCNYSFWMVCGTCGLRGTHWAPRARLVPLRTHPTLWIRLYQSLDQLLCQGARCDPWSGTFSSSSSNTGLCWTSEGCRWLWSSLLFMSEIEIDQLMYFGCAASSSSPTCNLFVRIGTTILHVAINSSQGLCFGLFGLGRYHCMCCVGVSFIWLCACIFIGFNFYCELHSSCMFRLLQSWDPLEPYKGKAAPGLWPVHGGWATGISTCETPQN